MEDLLQHQQENVEWIQRVRKGLLADQPGLGKSRSAIEAVKDTDSVLVVAPKMIINARVWQDEIERWAGDPSKFTIAPFSMLNDRVKTGRNASSTKPVKRVREEYRRHFDAVIIDEAHYIKGRGNFWTEAVQKITKASDIVVPMTGTPIPNWSHELFTVLQLIHPDESKPGQRFGGFWRWAGEWFDTTPTRFSDGNPVVGEMLECTPKCKTRNPEDPCSHFRKFALANLGDRWMRHLRDDCLDLPPLNVYDIPSPMSSDTQRAYRNLKRDFATHYEDGEILAWTQGSLNVILDRITTSPWLVYKKGDPHGGKLDLLDRDLAGLVPAGEQVLAFAHYQDSVEACARVASRHGSAGFVHGGMTDAQIEREVLAFKQGKTRTLVGSLETLAEGVTLTMANTAIFVERSFKPSRNQQATYRIHRMGQTRPCQVIRYITPHSVDSKKERLLASKTDHQMRMMSAATFATLL